MTTTHELLARLIAFPTVSRDSNLALIDFVSDYLASHGIAARLVRDESGRKANLHATIGPAEVPGVILSGHSDVVPVEGQAWSSDPFTLTPRAGRLYGRGSCDMKGFIAAVLALVPKAVKAPLKRPLHIALSYDEEVGCLGVRRLLDLLAGLPVKPAFCIIGEPTELQVVVAHKGKVAAEVRAKGRAAHSSLAPDGVNAIHLASDMIQAIRHLQAEVMAGQQDPDYAVPFTTLHVGTIQGGTALNIVPDACRFAFEIRNLPHDDPQALLQRLRLQAEALTTTARQKAPEAGIEIVVTNDYPALDTGPEEEIVAFVQALTGGNSLGKISFGTEGGLFQSRLGVPTVICGPGSIEQAHKPDEYVSAEQLARCDLFLAALLEKLTQ